MNSNPNDFTTNLYESKEGFPEPSDRPLAGSLAAVLRPQECDDGINDSFECVRRQHGELARDEILTGGEQLAWASVADHPQRAGRECSVIQFDRSSVAVCLARDLTEDLIAATGVGEHDRGPQFGLGEVGERKSDQNHRAYWR